MSKSVIPPTPTGTDYTQDPAYKEQSERNAGPLFHNDNPIALFQEWMTLARKLEPNDSNAMSLATLDDQNIPDVRIVLLKSVDERGFVFYSNAQSDKGLQLEKNPVAALCFHWKSLRRQVRVRGKVSRVSDKEADAYFAGRARGSQIGAWASDQSRPLESREVFEARLAATEREYGPDDKIARPPHWGGWRVIPNSIEFWRDRPYRLHDRLRFERGKDNWQKERLFP